ncbi:MAG: 4Fe-4S binding protein [Melioribacteraceae bacterium]|nr:4Fe-4S binding protein [Melioribacteraceae bacterium]
MKKSTSPTIQDSRFYIQLFFAALTIWIGIEFYFFVGWLESGGAVEFFPRPPGAEAFLPISSLMSLLLFFKTGVIHPVHPAGLFIFVAILSVSFVFGKSFCSWICPIGLISELIGDFGAKIQKKLFKRNLVLPKFLDYPLRSLKYLLLLFFVDAILRMSAMSLQYFLDAPYNVMSDVKMYEFFAEISQFSLIVIASLFLLSIVIRNFWCRYLCPYGALLGISSLLSFTKIKRNKETCTDCKACTIVCPSNIKVHKIETVISDECVACLQCVDSCPVPDSLELRAAIGKKKFNKKYVGLAILLIYFIILGVGVATDNWQNNISKEKYLELYPYRDSFDHLNNL